MSLEQAPLRVFSHIVADELAQHLACRGVIIRTGGDEDFPKIRLDAECHSFSWLYVAHFAAPYVLHCYYSVGILSIRAEPER